MIAGIRKKAGKYIQQMHHCTRCRADAIGLLGEGPSAELMSLLQECEALPAVPSLGRYNEDRPNIAVASMEGLLINQHLGEAFQLFIYGRRNGKAELIETRQAPEPGTGMARWETLSETIADCGMLLVSGIGENPRQVLTQKGIEIMVAEGMISEAVSSVFEGKSLNHLIKRKTPACGTACSGAGTGCG